LGGESKKGTFRSSKSSSSVNEQDASANQPEQLAEQIVVNPKDKSEQYVFTLADQLLVLAPFGYEHALRYTRSRSKQGK
jgi:hypothetical protein